jgi:acetyl-CoA/propionyl-CoA carboxylase carboxyl transferase subunit
VTAEALAPASDQVRDPRDAVVRLGRLMDGNDIEFMHPADDCGVQTAFGRIRGARVAAYCTDATRMGGALGAAGAARIIDAIEAAVREHCPVIGLWHSGGARLADGVESMDAVGRMFAAMTRASGRVPQISLVLGPAAGAAAYGPALTDIVIMAQAARVFVTGPDVVRDVTGERVDMETLGGPEPHSRKSGVAHLALDSEDEAYDQVRRIVDLLGRPEVANPYPVDGPRDLRALLPESRRRAYDVRPLVQAILDGPGPGRYGPGGFEELQPRWAPNMVIGLGRLGGRTLGVLANNPLRKGGCLDSLSAEKASRFVRMCDSLGVPLLVIVDVPGYLPGVSEEWGGVVRRGAKLLHAFAEAVVPRVTLVTRKAYGGAYIAMNSRSLGATRVFAWPGAEIAVMGAEAAVGILYRKRLAAAPDEEREQLKAQLIEEQIRISGGVSRAMAIDVVDEVIAPEQTRERVAQALREAPGARGDHGNIPL